MLDFLRQPWPWYVAGPLIGLMVPLLLIIGNKSFGISSSLRHICAACLPSKVPFFNYEWKKEAWNLFMVAGILLGGMIAGQWHSLKSSAIPQSAAWRQLVLLPMGKRTWRQLLLLLPTAEARCLQNQNRLIWYSHAYRAMFSQVALSRSLKASPIRFNESTVIKIIRPGNNDTHQVSKGLVLLFSL